jgi:hypothetical protein
LFPFSELGKVDNRLEVVISHAAISRAVSNGVDGELIRAGIQAVAPPSDVVSRALDQLSVVLGRVMFVQTAGFLWCDDADVRELLRSRRQTQELFLDPSPPAGLLVVPGKTVELLARRCRSLGVELLVEGQVVRARSTVPPGLAEPVPGRSRTTRPPAAALQETSKSRRSPAKKRSRPPSS